MRRRPPISTRTDTLFPYTTLFRSTAGINQGREPRSAHPSLTPSQLYRTADGWIFIMCNKEKFWPVLASAVGHPEWADDPEFATFADRLSHRDRVPEMLDAARSIGRAYGRERGG